MLFCAIVANSFAQTTEFSYQGRLLDNSLPPTGNYDLQFRLWDSETGGGGFGVVTRANVPVSQGIFTVVLDFGNLFTGPERWLAISIRPAGSSEQFLELSGRQRLTSTPYAIKSLNSDTATTATNSTQLGGVPASEYVVTTDPRMDDERAPSPGSGNYIQNRITEQAASDFNVSGAGNASTFNARSSFQIDGRRVLTTSGDGTVLLGFESGMTNLGENNTFLGRSAGRSNVSGAGNSFVGSQAGFASTGGSQNSYFGYGAGADGGNGSNNSFFGFSAGLLNQVSESTFFGSEAGQNNTTGPGNSFFGYRAGYQNETGQRHSLFGHSAGQALTGGLENSMFGYQAGFTAQGSQNSFFGALAGFSSTTGSFNSFFGQRAGYSNTQGLQNVYVGTFAGNVNQTGSSNTVVGAFAGRDNLASNSTFVGAFAGVLNSSGADNSFYGESSGRSNTTGARNSFFGIGTGRVNVAANDNSFFGAFTGNANLDGWSNSFYGSFAGQFNVSGNFNSLFGARAGRTVRGLGNTLIGSDAGVQVFDGIDNTFVGKFTGINNNSGSSNTFVGSDAGQTNVGGSSNSLFGARANFVSGGLSFATAIGADATVSTSNTIALGRANGSDVVRIPGSAVVTGSSTFGGTTTFTGTGTFAGSIAVANNANINGNAVVGGSAVVSGNGNVSGNAIVTGNVGIGTPTPNAKMRINPGQGQMLFGNPTNGTAFCENFAGLTFGPSLTNCLDYSISGNGATLRLGVPSGGKIDVFTGGSESMSFLPGGFIRVWTLDTGGVIPVCLSSSFTIGNCSSSVRYKEAVANWNASREILSRLRPVSFQWKASGDSDIGLVAEEVAEIEPLLVTYNDKGEIEGVKYDRIGVVLVNVVKEQQQQISAQQKQIDELKAIVCGLKPDAALCQKED